LHYDMPAALTNLPESILFEDFAHLASREDPELTQPLPQDEL
jgi:hypothetical protein